MNVLYRGLPALAAAALLVGCIDRGVAFLEGEDDAGSATPTSSASTDASTTSTGAAEVCGDDTPAVVAAANAFLASVASVDGGDAGDAGDASAAQVSFTEANAERWTNQAGGARNGPDFAELTPAQQDRALALARAALSTAGYDELQEIRAADEVLASTVASDGGAAAGWGSALTHVAILGAPSASSPWMLQIGLHQLAYNIVYNGPQISGTPVFLGTEPTNWTLLADGRTVVTGLVNGASTSFLDGVRTTTAISTAGGTAYAAMEPQRVAVESLLGVLLPDARNAASARLAGSFTDVLHGVSAAGGDSDFPVVYPTGTSGRGVLYSSLTVAEKAATLASIEAWVDTQACDIRAALLAAYESDDALAATYVGYGVPLGADEPSFLADPDDQEAALDDLGSYVRIDGPRVWIEMVVVQADAFRDERWVQYHSLWRDKLADYGAAFTGRVDGGGSTAAE